MTSMLFWLSVNSFAQPSWAGSWTGFLNHQACVPISSRLMVSLYLQQQSYGVTGEVRYYLSQQDTTASPGESLFAFPVTGRFSADRLVLKYYATEELRGLQFSVGYYVMGGYSLILDLDSTEDGQKLTGRYVGSNGGKGIITLKRPTYLNNKDDSQIISMLRKRQQQRKIMQQSSEKAAKDQRALVVSAGNKADSVIQQAPAMQQVAADMPSWVANNDSLRQIFLLEKATAGLKSARKDSLHAVWRIPTTEAYVDLQLYDNAEIDGDSISLFVNDVLVLHRVGLSASPIVYRLYRPDDGSISTKVTMVAENLGTIPPNTALLQAAVSGELRRVNLVASLNHHGTIECLW